MEYMVGTSGLHAAIIDEIRKPCSVGRRTTIIIPKRSSGWRSIGRSLFALALLVRCALDSKAHVYIPHPFHPWFAAFAAVARRLSIYDDGIAYYYPVAIPERNRVQLYRLLSARFFDWRSIARFEPEPTYPMMLRGARATSVHALFPDLLPELRCPAERISLQGLAPSDGGKEQRGITLFLDGGWNDLLSPKDHEPVLAFLKDVARSSEGSVLYYRPHPSGSSHISGLLANVKWAAPFEGVLETRLKSCRIERVYSFFSSGALSVYLSQPTAEVYMLHDGPLNRVQEGLLPLLRKIDGNLIDLG